MAKPKGEKEPDAATHGTAKEHKQAGEQAQKQYCLYLTGHVSESSKAELMIIDRNLERDVKRTVANVLIVRKQPNFIHFIPVLRYW